MDDNLTCDVCSCEYDVSNVVPKVLQCGHSFCLPCVTKIAQNTSVCPKCQHTISGDVNSFPTNYSVLGIVESYKSIKTLESHIASSIDIMKNKYLQRKELYSTPLEVIENGLAKLGELTDSDCQEIDTRKARKVLAKLEEGFRKSDDFVHFDCGKLKLSASISLRSFENPEMYLSEIFDRLMNKESLYAVKNIEDTVKYGKLSIYEKKLKMNSLNLTEVPQDSSVILLDDLRQCANLAKPNPFIEVAGVTSNDANTVVITFQMFDRSLSEIFIKICTGESGPSLKNCLYKKGEDISPHQNILHVESKCEAKKLMSYSNYTLEHPITINNTNACFLQIKPNGDLDIYRYYSYNSANGVLPYFPHAQVISPYNLYERFNSLLYANDKWFQKIDECGLLFSL